MTAGAAGVVALPLAGLVKVSLTDQSKPQSNSPVKSLTCQINSPVKHNTVNHSLTRQSKSYRPVKYILS